MSDERFARQYRFGPPPRFPLASSCTSIVHHLSGPNIHAQARSVHPRDHKLLIMPQSVWFNRFLYAQEFTTRILAHTLDSLVRVSRRVGWQHYNGDRMQKGKKQGKNLKSFTTCENSISPDHWNKHRKYDPILQKLWTENETSRLENEIWNTATAHQKYAIRFHLTISRTFNILFKVLFIFPSRYLCAIGLPQIFSFRRILPPI